MLMLGLGCVFGQSVEPKPFGPVPTANQLRWQQMEYYAFVHFSTNTFTDQEWGFGSDNPSIFNPTELDARQWARVCKQAGMKGIIITAKHHSGFCLWPSAYTEYSVKNSPWKGGKGDIVGDLAKACKEYGLKLGIYLSPWDRNHKDYGKPEYITYFRNQLTELLTNYGDIFEIWFDGANGGTGYYGGANENRKIDRKTYYDWSNTYKLIRQLQPNIVIWNDGGDRADLRWVGTEDGYVGETNWSLLNAKGDVPEDMLRYGVEDGDSWVPGEVNTSIRPGWFYHEYEDKRVKTLPQLMHIYYNSFGRNGTLLLNFPIDKRGLIHSEDEAHVLAFAKAVKEAFAINLATNKSVSASSTRATNKKFSPQMVVDTSTQTYWTTDDDIKQASLIINLGKPTAFNRFLVQEYIALGQRVKAFTLEAFINGAWQQIAKETTIGYKRILVFPTVKTTQIRFTVTEAKSCPLISNIGIFNAPQLLSPPVIRRDQTGMIHMETAEKSSPIYYSLDGSDPTKKSTKYVSPVKTSGKVLVKAISYHPATLTSSTQSSQAFDVDRSKWKIVGSDDPKAALILDGDLGSAWYQPQKLQSQNVDLVVDLGEDLTLTGFHYLPGQYQSNGIITHYQFFVSQDNQQWKMMSEGEFSNIINNRLWQSKNFTQVKARYIKLHSVSQTESSDKNSPSVVGYAEVDVITP